MYNPSAESSYLKSSKEIDDPRQGLINIQNADDKECLKWCLVRYLNPVDCNPARITKPAKKLILRIYIFKKKLGTFTKLKSRINLSVNLFVYENKAKYPIYVPKNCFENLKSMLI